MSPITLGTSNQWKVLETIVLERVARVAPIQHRQYTNLFIF